MAIFGRRRGAEAGAADIDPGTNRDDGLPEMTRTQADELRRLYASAMTSLGVEVAVHADHLAAADGRQFGLTNLARHCVQAGPPSAWAPIVFAHAETMVDSRETPDASGIDGAQVLQLVRARIQPADFVPTEHQAEHFVYQRPLAEGLTSLLVLDYPDHVEYVTDELVARVGADDMWAAGTAALLAEPIEGVQNVPGADGAHFAVVHGPSVYVAARALVLARTLADIGVTADLRHGVIIGLAHRNHLMFHVVADASVMPSIGTMTSFCQTDHNEGASPISPWLYYWHDARLIRLTAPDGAGNVVLRQVPEFAAALEAVAV